ncbi:hypothetical protein VB711_16625, partial [Cronbergia sp. UHCC 0137]|uniref:hypothetical protein n=1 Tax=Cronbergia sp. UHCC 0137 TaxID=3110239 RepID=UPI002B205720
LSLYYPYSLMILTQQMIIEAIEFHIEGLNRVRFTNSSTYKYRPGSCSFNLSSNIDRTYARLTYFRHCETDLAISNPDVWYPVRKS